MSFWGHNFVWDGIPSEMYDLFISSPDGGDVEITTGNDVELLTETIYRRPTPYLLGVQQSPVLSFDVSFNCPYELTGLDLHTVNRWLFGHLSYKKLRIVQDDISDVYFNCVLKNPRVHKVGNINRGIRATVVCDSPWGWIDERTYTYTYESSPSSSPISFYNDTDNNYYTYPKIEFVTTSEEDFTLVNSTDNSRSFAFTTLAGSITVYVNNDLQTAVDNNGTSLVSSFNKNWFRLLPGQNNLLVTAAISSLKFIYSLARKVS